MPHTPLESQDNNSAGVARPRLVCACFGLSDADILEALEKSGNSFDELVAQTRVGTRCTACLLDVDLLLNGAVPALASPVVEAEPPVSRWRRPDDQANCGYFVQGQGIDTVLRVANYGIMFDSETGIVAHRYHFVAFSPGGRVWHRQRGILERDDALEIRFRELAVAPDHGWFIIDLRPCAEGVVGSLRPQVGVVGKNWAATYHPQWLSFQTSRRAVLSETMNGKSDLVVTLINTHRRAAVATLSMRGLKMDYRNTQQVDVPALGCVRWAAADGFVESLVDGTCLFSVQSSRPLLYYITNVHEDGTWCVDHFPNEK